MQREIKFRAWDKENKEMLYIFSINGFGGFSGMNNKEEKITNKDVEIMQYTGLKDKNGVEIYEGDIIEEDFGETEKLMVGRDGFEIVFSGGAFKAMHMKSMFDNPQDFYLHQECLVVQQLKGYKVIGNIYQNKELLIKRR